MAVIRATLLRSQRGQSVDSSTGHSPAFGPLTLKQRPRKGDLRHSSSCPSSRSGREMAEWASKGQGKPCSEQPRLGTHASSWGRRGAPSMTGARAPRPHPLEDPREERFKGQTPSSPESCPEPLISVHRWPQPLRPQGRRRPPCADCYLSRARRTAFAVTSSKGSEDSDKLFKEEVRVIIFRDF